MRIPTKLQLMSAALIACAIPTQAAITGQWDFNNDLSATIGQDITFWDPETQAGTSFGTTTSFGIPNIGGQEARVMKFPKTAPGGGFLVPNGASPNGGGGMVNQFTIVMDVYFPESSSGKQRALIDSDFAGDADYYVTANNGLSVGDNSGTGNVTPNTWHRIAFAVDLTVPVVDKYVDGVKVGSQTIGSVDSSIALFDSFLFLYDDDGETEAGYINSLQFQDVKLSDGLIAVLNGPKAEGILTGPPPNPYISSVAPDPDSYRIPSRSTVPPQPEIRIEVENGVSKINQNSIVLKFDDAVVNPIVTTQGETTIITYTPPVRLPALSVHKVNLTFSDNANPPNSLGTQYQFAVGQFSDLPSDAALPPGTANTPGFKIKTVQAYPYTPTVGDPKNLAQTITRGIQQLNGTLRDNEGRLLADQSVAGPAADLSYAWDGVVNFSSAGVDVGNFTSDSQFPGIPGTDPETGSEHNTQFTTEVLTFLDLKAGVHRFGITVNISRVDVNDDDGYTLFVGKNPRDVFSHVVGSYSRNSPLAFPENAQSSNEFTFNAPADGIYPFRLVFYQGGHEASLEWWSVDLATGEKILINDLSNPKAIKAYQNSTSTEANLPYIAEVSPRPGTLGNRASDPVRVLIHDDRTDLNQSSIRMTFDGASVTPSITTEVPSTKITDRRTVVTYQPNATRTDVESNVHLEYADNASPPHQVVRDWSFNISVLRGSTTIVRGQWDFDKGNLAATVGRALEPFDGTGGDTETKTQFGSASSFGIPGINGEDVLVMKVPGDLSNKIGYKMYHGISANGGGTKVNQYTMIYDVYLDTTGPGAASMIQIDDYQNNANDGDVFWQGNNFGQGIGGYVGTGIFTPGAWHRVAFAVDLTTGTITKFVDGVKQDDWRPGDSVDGRRALNEYAILFADGDADERRVWYVNSVQVREGKMTDAELAMLGGPASGGIQREIPATNVAGQWDFDRGNLAATVGRALEPFDGAGGETETKTRFGTASSFGIPGIDGQDVAVMEVPGDLSNKIGYKMYHRIPANGGGSKVNQYTMIYDVYLGTSGPGAASMIQIDDYQNNANDGDVFWQGNNFGQGIGGYVGTGIFTPGAWHRVAFAVDLTTGVISKFVDGVKQDDWRPGDSVDGRRALNEWAILFADGDADERRVWYVNSVQIREGKLSDAQLVALGGPSAGGIPIATPQTSVTGQWDFDRGNLAATAGRALEYFDGAGGETETKTEFGTASSFGIPGIDGQDVAVMKVPGDLSNKIGYKMYHRIPSNGGGNKVNQYTMIYDVYLGTSGPGAASMIQIDDYQNNANDGDVFWQGNNFGQGIGGYVGTGIFTPGAWHRVAFAVDLTKGVISKFVDGVKQDDWRPGDSVDGRRALNEWAILFADGDADERRVWYVNSVQVREGKLSDAQIVALGGPSASGIPLLTPRTTVTGQWDFDRGNLAATAGRALEFFDGAGGESETKTRFGTASSFGIPGIDGQDVAVMEVPGDLSNKIGYKMYHQIPSNGGGNKVNQYTMIYDVYLGTSGPGAASMIQIDDYQNNANDGDVFWQGNNFGQGIGGYVGTGIFTPGAWHRVSFAVDLTTGTITKFVDGVKQDDWKPGDAVDGRRALNEWAILFADGDADERRVWYVNSVQVREGKLSDADLEALGGPEAAGIPIVIGVETVEPGPEAKLTITRQGNQITISWPAELAGFVLESTTDLRTPNWTAVQGVVNNSYTRLVTLQSAEFFRLRKQ